ncbi:MAG: DMT family transporter [Hyphomicrobiaceae bacterium]
MSQLVPRQQHGSNYAVEIGLLALLALLWGSSYLFIKVALTEIPPITIIAARVLIAALLLLSVMHLRDERLPREVLTWRMLLVQAFFNSIGAWTILAWGQQYLDSGLASVLNSTAPIFVFFATWLITRHEAVNGLKLLGALLGLVGVVLIVGVDALNGLGKQVLAQLAVITGAILYACAAIYGNRFSGQPAIVTAAGTMIWASVCLVPLSLLVDQPWTLQPSFKALASVLLLGLICTGVALLIYFRLMKTLGSLGVASQAYLRAGVGVLLGVVILGERITPLVGLGLVATMFGVAAMNVPRRAAASSQVAD